MQDIQEVKNQTRKKIGGRQLGSKNKFGSTAKENFMAVFVRLGGTAAMAKWAADNNSEFYKLYARLIPTEVDAAISGGLTLTDRDPTQRPEGYQRRGKAST
jgi:hypothetical protein